VVTQFKLLKTILTDFVLVFFNLNRYKCLIPGKCRRKGYP
jgi:hypothetical protein